MVGEKVGECATCEPSAPDQYDGEFPKNNITTQSQDFEDGTTLERRFYPLVCGSGQNCTKKTDAKIRYLRRYEPGISEGPSVAHMDVKKPKISLLDLAVLVLDSSYSRYYVDHELTETILQYVQVSDILLDTKSRSFISGNTYKTFYPIDKSTRIIHSDFMGITNTERPREIPESRYLEEMKP